MDDPQLYWENPAAMLPEGLVDTVEKLRSLPVAEKAKWALLVAAVGGHSAAFVGPPDVPTGELIGLLPELLPMARCVSIPAATLQDRWSDPADLAAVRAAEVILIQDFGAVPSPVLRVLEDRLQIGEQRTGENATPPQVLIAAKPCPCGFLGDSRRGCTCSVRAWASYISRRHASVLGTVDVHVDVAPLPDERTELVDAERLALQVERARRRQHPPRLIAHLTETETLAEVPLGDGARWALRVMARYGSLSAAETLRHLRIAFSLAVLEQRTAVVGPDLVKAHHWRRTWWPEPQEEGWMAQVGAALRRLSGESP